MFFFYVDFKVYDIVIMLDRGRGDESQEGVWWPIRWKGVPIIVDSNASF